MVISDQVTVEAPLATVYGLYADLSRWPEVLPDIVSVDVHYTDGYHQEFSMTVERPSGRERVRGVRYCRAPYELELFLTTPPPGLSRISGVWTFSEENGRTTVAARRMFHLLDEKATERDEQEAAERLRGYLKTKLDLFRRAAEREYALARACG